MKKLAPVLLACLLGLGAGCSNLGGVSTDEVANYVSGISPSNAVSLATNLLGNPNVIALANGILANPDLVDALTNAWADVEDQYAVPGDGSTPEPPSSTNAPADPAMPIQTPTEGIGANISDEDAKEMMAKMSFLDGTPRNGIAVRLVKWYSSRISHFGGGNRGQAENETYLWKPVGNDGNLVIITPSHTYIPKLTVSGNGYSDSKTGISVGNGWRPHWRFPHKASAYGSEPMITAAGVGTARISTPAKKQSFKISTTLPAPVSENTESSPAPSYAPGQVVIPADFLAHGKMTELRFQHCSVANGLMVQQTGQVYSIVPPTHEIWTKTVGSQIGTKARFSDGAIYDGYVNDYHGSYPMPVQKLGSTSGRAFWVRVK